MLELSNLSKVYRTEDIETHALDDVSMTVNEGEFLAVMGPSGCGKSTFLSIVGMLDTPSGGAYRFMDEDVSGYSESRLASLRKGNIGFIFQSFNLIDELSVAENVEMPLLYMDMPKKDRRCRVREVLELVGLNHRATHRPRQLSGGEQQRVAVARAVVADPKVILADEPTGNLDSKNGEDVMDMLTTLNAEGATIIMVTHSPSHAAYAHRTINFQDGRIVSQNELVM